MSKVGIDCEMVLDDFNRHMLARVSLVNENGNKIYDSYVKPQRRVGNYLVNITGLNESHLRSGKDFSQVQNEVISWIRGKILVGHTVHKDLEVLGLTHPSADIKDIALMPKFMNGNQPRNLKDLAREHLNILIQQGYHDSFEDANAAMRLYTKYYY